MNTRILSLCILVWTGSALAGAWDTGSFDNDSALDWVWELSESNDLSVVKDTLRAAANSSGYLDADTASMAIAAAEVVAALRGNPRSELPAEVTEWVQAHRGEISDDLLKVTRRAVENIKKIESSELAQLWSDSDEFQKAWLADIDDLLQRLQ